MRGRTPRWRTLAAGCGALLAVAALVCTFTWASIFDYIVSLQTALRPDSRSFREWRAPSVPLYFEVFLFNWTNSERFPDEPPHLEEIGPYRFVEQRSHVNITWHPNNGSITYRTFRRWFFDEASSNGSMADNITTLNVIAVSAMYRARYWDFIRQGSVLWGLKAFGHTISVTRTAGEFLFDGYEDSLLDIAKTMPDSVTGGAPPVDRFGWFYGRNNSFDTDGVMTVSTGVTGLPGQVLRWNGADNLPYYDGICGQLSGTAGEFFPRDLTELSRLKMFVPDMCRTIRLDYVYSGDYGGLNYHKYALSEEGFDNSPSQENTCFCNGPCSWAGTMNISACRYDSPSVVSLPHFLHGDPELRTLATGLRPDVEKHSFYISVEPRLGVPVEVAARFQINVYLEPSENVFSGIYAQMPRMLFPVIWVQQKVQMDDDLVTELRVARAFLDWGSTVSACVALMLSVLVAMMTLCSKKTMYQPPAEVSLEKPIDEAELKLNPK